jgi:hypothetical protein
MSVVGDAVRGVGRTASRAAELTTEAAGAVGGAAVNGVVGGVQGVATGVQRGLKSGSHSTPAAALTLGAIGAAGLIEWPVLLAVGAGALVLRRIKPHPDDSETPAKASLRPAAAEKAPPSNPAPAHTGAAGASRSPTKRTTRAKKTAPRSARGGQSRSAQ